MVKAVNLGGDADTIGAITGGLAGALYGYEAIPVRWKSFIDRKTRSVFKPAGRRRNKEQNGELRMEAIIKLSFADEKGINCAAIGYRPICPEEGKGEDCPLKEVGE